MWTALSFCYTYGFDSAVASSRWMLSSLITCSIRQVSASAVFGSTPAAISRSVKKAVLFVDLFRYLAAHVSQMQEKAVIHGEEPAVLHSSHRVARAGLGNFQVPGHIYERTMPFRFWSTRMVSR